MVCEIVSKQKNAQLHQLDAAERLRLLIESVREYSIFQLDPEGYVIGWNAGAERMVGYASPEAVSPSLDIIIHKVCGRVIGRDLTRRCIRA